MFKCVFCHWNNIHIKKTEFFAKDNDWRWSFHCLGFHLLQKQEQAIDIYWAVCHVMIHNRDRPLRQEFNSTLWCTGSSFCLLLSDRGCLRDNHTYEGELVHNTHETWNASWPASTHYAGLKGICRRILIKMIEQIMIKLPNETCFSDILDFSRLYSSRGLEGH